MQLGILLGIPAPGGGNRGTPVITPSLRNGGFETAGTPFGTWVAYHSGTSSVNDETTVVHSGGHSCRLGMDGVPSAAGVQQAAVITLGRKYLLTFWARATGAATVRVETDGSTITTTAALSTTDWTLYTVSFTGDATGSLYLSRGTGTAGSVSLYLDDVTLTDLGT